MNGELTRLQAQVQSAILGQGELSPPGLEVYCNAYRLRVIEALAADYPVLARWLGQDQFARLACDYVAAYPSGHFSIRWIGRRLPDFLHHTGPPEWEEMAAFEWALSLAFDCLDTVPIEPDVLTAIPAQNWPQLRFQLHPSLSLLALHTPVPRVWKALQAQEVPPDCPHSSTSVNWMVWRRGLQLFFRSLGDAEAQTLRMLWEGSEFAEICVALSDRDLPTDIAHQVATWLHRWMEEGLIVGVDQS